MKKLKTSIFHKAKKNITDLAMDGGFLYVLNSKLDGLLSFSIGLLTMNSPN